jgi:lysophospholipase L1-like esterase
MRRQYFWVKVLVLTNLATIVFLAIVSLHYQVPLKVFKRLGLIKNNEKTVSTYDVRNNLFSEYYPQKYKIVMLGDSITAGTAWNELLGINDIANRGISGDTTEGFYNRLSNIYFLKPELCFIMGGINDIAGFYPVNVIQNNFEKIIKNLLENEINPIIQSTLYVSNEHPHWRRLNHTVDELNESLKNICQKYNIIFLDINTILSVDGALRKEYTYDGAHLTGLGYKEWSKIIIPIIENK